MLYTDPPWRTVNANASDYKPIADHAIIGDRRTCALIGIDASVDWMCLPRFDSPSVFGSLLDRKKGGKFTLLPAGMKKFEARQYYAGETNILCTEFKDETGIVRITDLMPCFEVLGVVASSRELHRRITCLSGRFEIDFMVEPRFDYGRLTPKVLNIGKNGCSFISSDSEIRQEIGLISPVNLEILRGRVRGSLKMKEGETADLVMRLNGLSKNHSQETNTEAKLSATRHYWRSVAKQCSYKGRWREYVVRSALLLHLLVFSQTGAIIAAPTTSLPEEIGGVRNWDYRYSWIRDSSFVMWAFHSIGDKAERESYVNWLTSSFYLSIQNLKLVVSITGDQALTERELETLGGYMGSSPVRVGNAASAQIQLDVYGILLDTLYFSHKHHRKISKKIFENIVIPVVSLVEQNWEKPDCGIWEVRSDNENFVYSKMWCWVAVDRAVRLAQLIGMQEECERWNKLKNRIRRTIYQQGWDKKRKFFVRSFGSKDADAANLLMPQVKFIAGDDPKMISTIEEIKRQLLIDGKFLYRYKSEDGLSGNEGTFLMCSFWLVSCLALAGKVDEAENLLENLVKYSNHVGLFAEEIDPKTGAMLGNFPQAFTHMGLISSVVAIHEQRKNLARAVNRGVSP